MRDFLTSSGRRLRAGWFWPLALLALPNCALSVGGLGPPPVFDGGPEPRTSAVMCDIPKVPAPGSSDCASVSEAVSGMSMSRAAIALVQGENNPLALDFSKAATDACGGLPRKIEFQGTFPDGYAVCLNCGTQMPVPYADGNAVCVAQCIDLVNHGGQPEPEEGAQSFCESHAHVSTNFDKKTCYTNACSSGGTALPNFPDPRRNQEPVKWVDFATHGTTPTNNTLTRTASTTGNFDAGAASAQLISTGDAWVEFAANETTKGHAVGLSNVPILVNGPPPDDDPTLADMQFAIVLDSDEQVYIFEGGTKVAGPIGDKYKVGERFRVRVTDNHDFPHTATITYTRLTASCTPGTICAEVQIGSQVAPSPSYFLRVDASLKEEGATLTNVTLARIQ